MSVGWTDSHCHLHDLPDAADAWARAQGAGVSRAVLIGTDPESSAHARAVAHSLGAGVWATVGLHPHEAARTTAVLAELVADLPDTPAPHPAGSVVGIGECGLDYFYEHSPRDAQREAFADQIGLAHRTGLTLVVHSRDAWADTFDILRAEGVPERMVVHCFTGGVEEARSCLELGAYLSFSGIVTFKNAGALREAAMFCPLGSLLVETDAPYLAPVPHRGRPNEPAFVTLVGETIAALRSEDPQALAEATSANAAAAFALAI